MLNLSNKQIIILVAIVVIIIALILYFTYRAGKKSSGASLKKAPNDAIGVPLTEEEKQYLDGLAVSLFNDMDGANMTWNNELYENVGLLGDNKLVALSNIFNYKYQDETGESFLQWLENENFGWDSFDLASKVEQIKNRLIALGVS